VFQVQFRRCPPQPQIGKIIECCGGIVKRAQSTQINALAADRADSHPKTHTDTPQARATRAKHMSNCRKAAITQTPHMDTSRGSGTGPDRHPGPEPAPYPVLERGTGFSQERDTDSARNREPAQSAEREAPYSIRLEAAYGWRTGLSPLSLPDLPPPVPVVHYSLPTAAPAFIPP
jgi:hypothetical protein